MPRIIAVAFAVVWIITAASPTRAANLLTNPGFTTDFSDWRETAGKTWDPFDADGSGASGSVRMPVPVNNSILVWQCVSAAAGQDFSVGATMWAQPGAAGSGGAKVAGIFFSTTDCTGPALEFHPMLGSSSSTWERIEGSYVTPTGTQSARISLTCASDAVATDFVCYADNAYLPEPSETLLSLVALGSLAGLAQLRRSRLS